MLYSLTANRKIPMVDPWYGIVHIQRIQVGGMSFPRRGHWWSSPRSRRCMYMMSMHDVREIISIIRCIWFAKRVDGLLVVWSSMSRISSPPVNDMLQQLLHLHNRLYQVVPQRVVSYTVTHRVWGLTILVSLPSEAFSRGEWGRNTKPSTLSIQSHEVEVQECEDYDVVAVYC